MSDLLPLLGGLLETLAAPTPAARFARFAGRFFVSASVCAASDSAADA